MWTLAVQNSDELIYIWSVYTCLFSIWTTRKMHDFQGYFSWTFQDQSDFPGLSMSWNFQEKKSRTFQEAWEPCRSIRMKTQVNWEILKFYLSPHEYPLTDHAGYLLHRQLLLAQIWSQLASGIYRQQVREKTPRQDSNVKRRLLLCTRQKYIGAGSYIVSTASTWLAVQVSVNVRQ